MIKWELNHPIGGAMIKDDQAEFEWNSNSTQLKFESNSKLIPIQPNQAKAQAETQAQSRA